MYDNGYAFNEVNTNDKTVCNEIRHNFASYRNARKQLNSSCSYQYDSQYLYSTALHNASEHSTRFKYQPEKSLQYNDILVDNIIDHYENLTSGSVLQVNVNVRKGGAELAGESRVSESVRTDLSNNSLGSNSLSTPSTTLQQPVPFKKGGVNSCFPAPVCKNFDYNRFEKPKAKKKKTIVG